MSMMMGVAFSLGMSSTRMTPSIGSGVPRWAVMSSSAGNDMGSVLLWDNGFHGHLAEKVCKRWNFVGGAFHADHRRAVHLECRPQRAGQIVDVRDVDRGESGEHGGEAGPQSARPEIGR